MPKAPKEKKSKPVRGLGRGLSALMDDVGMDTIVDEQGSVETKTEPLKKTNSNRPEAKARSLDELAPKAAENSINFVAMDQLTRNPDQPRRYFDKTLLEELTQSIRDKGVLQPILVRPLPESVYKTLEENQSTQSKAAYQIIAGERRWQAALKAGLDSVPVFIRDITDQQALEIGVVENVQRADLNPMEEALAYKSLLTQFGRTQEDVAQSVGKSRPYIANMLRLLNLPEKVQAYLAEGKITTGHARALIAMPDPVRVADAIVTNDLSVREVEKLARRLKDEAEKDGDILQQIKGPKFSDTEKHVDIKHLEARLSETLGLMVDLRDKGEKGELRIKYRNSDQLSALIQRLLSN